MRRIDHGAKNRTLVVEGLPDYFTSEQLEHEFSRYGVILSAQVKGRAAGDKQGDSSHGIVIFDRRDAMEAAARLHSGKFLTSRNGGRHVGPIRIGTPGKRDMGIHKDKAGDEDERHPVTDVTDSKAADRKSDGPAIETGLESMSQASLATKIADAARAAADDKIGAFVIIEPGANLGPGVKIGPFSRIASGAFVGEGTVIGSHVTIDSGVRIGSHNKIGNYCWISGPDTTIGDRNEFVSHNVIGTRAEDYTHHNNEPTGPVIVGNANVFREYVTIHAPEGERGGELDGTTQIGNACYCMRGSHVGHDNRIEDGVTLACNVVLAGYVRVMEGANLGISVSVHQYTTIGSKTMIGMGSDVLSDVPPYVLVTSTGGLNRIEDLNTVGLMRAGRSDAEIGMLETWYQDEYRPSGGSGSMTADSCVDAWFSSDIQRFLTHRSRQHRNRPLVSVRATSPLRRASSDM